MSSENQSMNTPVDKNKSDDDYKDLVSSLSTSKKISQEALSQDSGSQEADLKKRETLVSSDSTNKDTQDESDIESKLLKFDENNTVNTGKDINTKITALDTDLAHLRAELGAINSSVEEGLDRLGDTDTDLTAKVSETYKRLGEIDNSYKSLIDISSRIDNDIKKLNGDVSTVAEASASGIKTLEKSSIAQSTDFTNKNQQVVSRVNQLVEASKLTGELLSQKIQATTEKIIQVEKQVVTEIQTLSSVTEEKSKTIEDSVGINKAKILKLQMVDEAIIKRATSLEISSAELSVKSQELISTTETLGQNTDSLSSELSVLQEKTRELEATANSHGSLIRSLQSASSKISYNIAVLSKRENKHYKIIVAGFVVLVIAAAAMFFLQGEKFVDVDGQLAERGVIVDGQIAGLQLEQVKAVSTTNDSLQLLENKLAAMNTSMQEEIKADRVITEQKMQKLDDQLQSVEGRVNNNIMIGQIANDNVIHSEQWIATQNKENYTLQIAYVNDKQLMFEIAESYNHYLNDSLSYFETKDNGVTKYVLLSGSYPSQQLAIEKIKALPVYIDMQRPVVRNIAEVQKYIAQ